MCGSREGRNVWWLLFHFWSYKQEGKKWYNKKIHWSGKNLFTIRFWKYMSWGYLWHDSFAVHWRRVFGCDHDPQVLGDGCCGPDGEEVYCFKCSRYLPS